LKRSALCWAKASSYQGGRVKLVGMTITNALDQFFTADHEVSKCLEAWQDHIKIDKDAVVIEPSAGAGAFSKNIDCLAFDLKPQAEDIVQADFLNLDFIKYVKTNSEVHFIGNPPFGKTSDLALKFIRRMTSFDKTKSFALILPAIHSRENYKNKIDTHFHLVHQHYVKDFVEFGKPKKVNCVFQIWARQESERKLFDIRKKSSLVSFVNPDQECDFKIGSKYKPGFLFPADYTYAKENRGSFKLVKIHDETLHEFLSWCIINCPMLLKVDRKSFTAVPHICNYEVVDAVEEIYKYLVCD